MRSSSAAQITPAAPTSTAAAIQVGLAPLVLPLSRVIRPSSDWLPAQPVKPVRPPWKNRPPNHHLRESPGRIAKPSSTVKAKPAQAIAACRNFLASSRYGMKISGTSLIPAAIPVPKPFHQRLFSVSGWHRSQMISAIRTRLTWPRYMVRRTGSVQKTAAAPSRVTASLVRPFR